MPNTLKIGIIGGTGLGEALGVEKGQEHIVDTPFGLASSPITVAHWNDVEVHMLKRHGVGHLLNPSHVPYRANIYALKKLGVTHIVASGATGSLREHIAPGDLVIADQIIDKTTKRAGTFFEKAAVHAEFSEPFCPVMRKWLLDAVPRLHVEKPGVKVHDKGAYVCMEGPAFSTKAESHMHRSWGGDLIGMTCMPEAKLAREAEIAYALVALPTDYDCWRPHPAHLPQAELLKEIIGNLQTATGNSIALIKAALQNVSALTQTPSPAHSALALGIWSDKSKIDTAEVEKLRILWGKYF